MHTHVSSHCRSVWSTLIVDNNFLLGLLVFLGKVLGTLVVLFATHCQCRESTRWSHTVAGSGSESALSSTAARGHFTLTLFLHIVRSPALSAKEALLLQPALIFAQYNFLDPTVQVQAPCNLMFTDCDSRESLRKFQHQRISRTHAKGYSGSWASGLHP